MDDFIRPRKGPLSQRKTTQKYHPNTPPVVMRPQAVTPAHNSLVTAGSSPSLGRAAMTPSVGTPLNADTTALPKPPQNDPFLPTPKPGKKPRFGFRFKLPRPKNRWQWGLLVAAIIFLLSASGFSIYWFIIRDTTPPVTYTPIVEPEPAPEPTTKASRMSGRQVDIATADRPVYAVQIENSPDARPQSGLKEADIVSEAIAEGGITRFNAIFHDNQAANIGPIRSLRPYYIDWFLPYGAAIVHAGGSPEALSDIRTLGIQDLDNTTGYFRRVSNRYAPHNLYSTSAQLIDLFNVRSYSTPQFTGLPRKEPKPADTATASIINLRISSQLYNVVFNYDKASNSYLRSQADAPHVDAETGQQLAPNVVVVPIINRGISSNGVNNKYDTVGSGEVFVFQDGTLTKGTWTKPDRRAQWQLTDAAGAPITLNPGQTWFSIVESADRVTFQ